MLCFSGVRTLVSLDIRGSEKSGFWGSVHGMIYKCGETLVMTLNPYPQYLPSWSQG